LGCSLCQEPARARDTQTPYPRPFHLHLRLHPQSHHRSPELELRRSQSRGRARDQGRGRGQWSVCLRCWPAQRNKGGSRSYTLVDVEARGRGSKASAGRAQMRVLVWVHEIEKQCAGMAEGRNNHTQEALHLPPLHHHGPTPPSAPPPAPPLLSPPVVELLPAPVSTVGLGRCTDRGRASLGPMPTLPLPLPPRSRPSGPIFPCPRTCPSPCPCP
jgi:hypothetical protein